MSFYLGKFLVPQGHIQAIINYRIVALVVSQRALYHHYNWLFIKDGSILYCEEQLYRTINGIELTIEVLKKKNN